MSYSIVHNGRFCIEKGEQKSWQQIYSEIERGKSPSFVLRLNDDYGTENDELGWVLEFGLCMWVFQNRIFYLNILCPEDKAESVGNKFLNFLRFFVEKEMLRLTINRIVRTTARIEKQVPDAYFPLLIVDQKMYREWFLGTLSENLRLKAILCGDENAPDTSSKESYPFYSEMAMKVCKKMLYSRSGKESRKIKKRLEEIYEDYLKNHSIMTVLISCILYNRLREGITLTGKSAIVLLGQTIKMAYVYKTGLQEVCENILRHTERKKGIVYLRSLSTEKTKERFEISSGMSEEGIEEFVMLSSKWFEMTVIDAGEKGILETQRIRKGNLEATFEWSDEVSDNVQKEEEEIAEIDALIYHKGLKIFNNQVRMSQGLFCVQTVHKESAVFYSSRSGRKGKTGENESGFGTQYQIWLPMIKRNEYIQKHFEPEQNVIADAYRAYQSYNTDRQEVLKDILYKNASIDYKIENGIEGVSVKQNALAECRRMLEFFVQNEKTFYYFDFENAEPEYVIKLMYFLGLMANKRNISYTILYNVDQNYFNQFLLNYQEDIESKWKVKEQKNYVFIFNKQGTPIYVTNDFNALNSKKLKMYLWAYRGIYYEGISNAFLMQGVSAEEQSAVLLPVEILNTQKERAFSAPIFEKHINQLFENQMSDSEKFGLQYVGHVNLGDKIHVSRYFQGELLFDNNYYLGALAYIFSRALGNKKKFFLVGYKNYSVGLLNKIKEYMGNNVVGTFIFDKIDRKITMPDIPEETEIVVIVPIASTLRTFEKVERFLRKEISGNYRYSYYAFFVSRDKEGAVTDAEADFNWQSIGNSSIKIKSEWPLVKWNEYREIHYFMIFSGGWQHAMDCEKCDRIKAFEDGVLQMEALMETGEDSLNLSVKLGIPYNKDPERFRCYTKTLDRTIQQTIYKNMSKYVIEGHFEHSVNHFKHYLYCGKFYEQYLKDCSVFDEWLGELQKEFQNADQEYVNVLLVPEHYSTTLFSKHVNKKVFHENTIIINENFEKEFYSDFTKKYNYLKKLKKIRYVFLDDCLNTGNTWKKVYSLVNRLGEGVREFYVISLVNRMDYSNKVFLSAQCVEFRFFTEICIPSIKEQNGSCWLCEESRHLERLYNDSFSYEMRKFYAKKKVKTERFCIVDETENDFAKFRRERKNTEINFLITNELYKRLFENYQTLEEGKTEGFKKFFGVADDFTIIDSIIGNKVDYQYRIAFLKTLSRPFINSFAGLRNFCVNVCMAEFQKLIQDGRQNSEEIDLQLSYLIVLIKRFGTLQCRYVLSRECFQQIRMFYSERNSNDRENSSDLALQYAVAVKQMMLGSEVNTLRFLEQFKSELLKPGNVVMWNDGDETVHSEVQGNDMIRRFLKCIFFSRDIIIQNAIRNYRTDYEVFKQDLDFDKKEELVLGNHTYSYYQRELSCFDVKERKKGSALLIKMKQLIENLQGAAAQQGGSEKVGFESLFREVLEGIEDFRVYFYKGSKKGHYHKIKGRQLDAPDSWNAGTLTKCNPETGIGLREYINWIKTNKQIKIRHLVTINDDNIYVSGMEFYINLAELSDNKTIGLIFVGKAEISSAATILLLYRLLSGAGKEIIELLDQIENSLAREQAKVENASEEDVKKMRGQE